MKIGGRMAGKARTSVCKGSALTEFAVLMVAFVPLIVGLPMIGKMIDLRQRAVQAGRYVAWESTVSSTGDAPLDLQARFFPDVRTSAPDVDGDPASRASEASADREGGRALSAGQLAQVTVDESSFATIAYSSAHVDSADSDSASAGFLNDGAPGAETSLARAMGEAVTTVAESMGTLTGGDWGFEGDGLQRSGVRFAVMGNGFIARSTFEETAVIMNDVWTVHDDAAAAKRARSFVPAGALDKLGVDNIIAAFGYIPVYKELRSIDDAFGRVDMTPLPESETAARVLRPEAESP